MPHPKAGYRNAAGEKVPSVTGILRHLGWKTEGIKHWAYKKGLEGEDLYETQQRAMDVGTLAHAMVDHAIRDAPFDPDGADPELVEKARRAFAQYVTWAEGTRLIVIATEVQFISEVHGFGGTADAIAMTKDGLSIPDWKSGAGVYGDNAVQLAAYLYAAEEVMGERFSGGAHLCRFDQNAGGFMHRWIPREALGPCWRVFLRLRDIHEQEPFIKELVK